MRPWVIRIGFALLGICPVMLFGQDFPEEEIQVDTFAKKESGPRDTSYFRVFFRDRSETGARDSFLFTDFYQYDPGRRGEVPYAHLGNVGSAAHPLVYVSGDHLGLRSGLSNYDLYRFDSDDVRYYRTTRAYANLFYSQGNEQEKSSTRVDFGRELARSTGVTIHYRRINELGEYDHQRNRHTSVAGGIYYLPEKGPFQTYFSFVSNKLESRDNGGIRTDTLFNEPFYDDRQVIPVWTSTASTQWLEREARATSYLRLPFLPEGFSFVHDLSYRALRYKFYDTNSDSAYYRSFDSDIGAQRFFFRWKTLRNRFESKIPTARDDRDRRISAGIEHAFHWILLEPENITRQNLIAYGRIRQSFAGLGLFTGDLQAGLFDQAGDVQARGRLDFNWKEVGSLYVFAEWELRQADFLSQRMILLEENVWDRDLDQVSEATVGGGITIPAFGLKAELYNRLIGQYVYYDTDRMPRQFDGTFNLLQLHIAFERRFGPFLTSHNLWIQNSAVDELPVPSFAGEHYAGLRTHLFRRSLQLDLGAMARTVTGYPGYGYFPLTGQFHLSERDLDYRYVMDGVISFRVSSFRFFFRFENINFLWDEKIHYLTEMYPQYDFRTRFGFNWILRD